MQPALLQAGLWQTTGERTQVIWFDSGGGGLVDSIWSGDGRITAFLSGRWLNFLVVRSKADGGVVGVRGRMCDSRHGRRRGSGRSSSNSSRGGGIGGGSCHGGGDERKQEWLRERR